MFDGLLKSPTGSFFLIPSFIALIAPTAPIALAAPAIVLPIAFAAFFTPGLVTLVITEPTPSHAPSFSSSSPVDAVIDVAIFSNFSSALSGSTINIGFLIPIPALNLFFIKLMYA